MFKRLYIRYLFLKAKRERKKGRYSKSTLNLFNQISLSTSNSNIKFSYLWVLRHFGYEINNEQYLLIVSIFTDLSYKNKILALNFILEYDPSYDVFKLAEEAQIKAWSRNSPPLCAFLKRKELSMQSDDLRNLSLLHESQEEWRQEFVEFVTRKNINICLVGNSNAIHSNSHGSVIDSHSIVIRFNNYLVGKSSGYVNDVWGKSPSYSSVNNTNNIDVGWSIISGPDIRYTMSNWEEVLKDLGRGVKVLTTPLHIWKKLILTLQAPPSIGLLTLAWVLDLVKDPNLVSIVGFQLSDETNAPYHHSSPKHKRGERHNWALERKLLRDWCNSGVNIIDSDRK